MQKKKTKKENQIIEIHIYIHQDQPKISGTGGGTIPAPYQPYIPQNPYNPPYVVTCEVHK